MFHHFDLQFFDELRQRCGIDQNGSVSVEVSRDELVIHLMPVVNGHIRCWTRRVPRIEVELSKAPGHIFEAVANEARAAFVDAGLLEKVIDS